MKIDFYHDDIGTICERCGQYIKNVVVITFNDGFTLRVGTDCINKVLAETNLSAYGTKFFMEQMRKIKREVEYMEKWESCESVEDMVAKNIRSPQVWSEVEGTWHYMTEEEFQRERKAVLKVTPARIERINQQTTEKLKGVKLKKIA